MNTTLGAAILLFSLSSLNAGELENLAAGAGLENIRLNDSRKIEMSAPAVAERVDDAGKTAAYRLEKPAAGLDYATDGQLPYELTGKKILVIRAWNTRIAVDAKTKLSAPIAGTDYPTDSPCPDWAIDGKVLVFNDGYRLPIMIEKAQAGINYPTNGPIGLNREFAVWTFYSGTRLPIRNITGIMKAAAGVDYPTNGPMNIDRDFYVVVSVSDSGEEARIRI